jgi:hypothetical protein
MSVDPERLERDASSSPASPAAGPPWVREAFAVAREEVVRFVATLAGFLRAPGRFCADWFAGEERALNPLGFIATALAISGAFGALTPSSGEREGAGALGALAQAGMPYLYYAAVGILSHPLLRLFGSRRPLGATLGVALFAGGGPGLLATLGAYLCYSLRTWIFGASPQLLRHLPFWPALALTLLLAVPLLAFFVMLMLAMAGLHDLPRRRAVAAVSLSLLVLAVLLGVLHRVVHFSIGIPHLAFTWYGRVPILDVWF